MAKGMEFWYDDAIVDYLTEKSYSVTYGARNLRRTIQKEIEDAMAAEIVDKRRGDVHALHLSVADGKVQIAAE